MIENARVLGANSIVSMRFDSSKMGQGPDRDRRGLRRGHPRLGEVGLAARSGVPFAVLGVLVVGGLRELLRASLPVGRSTAGGWQATDDLFNDPVDEPLHPGVARPGWRATLRRGGTADLIVARRPWRARRVHGAHTVGPSPP
jgi:hypothetical protein